MAARGGARHRGHRRRDRRRRARAHRLRRRRARCPGSVPTPSSSCTSSRARCSRPRASRSARSRACRASAGRRSRSPASRTTPAPRRCRCVTIPGFVRGRDRDVRARARASSWAAPRSPRSAGSSSHPNLVNVVAGVAPRFTVDLRNTDETRPAGGRAAPGRLRRRVAAAAEGCTVETRTLARFEPVDLRPGGRRSRRARPPRDLGHTVMRMPSGAGHDAQMLARVCPTAMIFTPSRDGVSHNPAEYTSPERSRGRGRRALAACRCSPWPRQTASWLNRPRRRSLRCRSSALLGPHRPRMVHPQEDLRSSQRPDLAARRRGRSLLRVPRSAVRLADRPGGRAPQPDGAEHRAGLARRRPALRAEDGADPRRPRDRSTVHRHGDDRLQHRVEPGTRCPPEPRRVRRRRGWRSRCSDGGSRCASSSATPAPTSSTCRSATTSPASRADKVASFIRGMHDATASIDALRPELTGPFAEFADLDFDPIISDTLTLSTFHGCPPDEIESITKHLIDEHDLDVIVKLNPTLLGYETVAGIVNDELGLRRRAGEGVGVRRRPPVRPRRRADRRTQRVRQGAWSPVRHQAHQHAGGRQHSVGSCPTTRCTSRVRRCTCWRLTLLDRLADRAARHVHDPRPRRRRDGVVLRRCDQGQPGRHARRRASTPPRSAPTCSSRAATAGWRRCCGGWPRTSPTPGATDLAGYRARRQAAAEATGHRLGERRVRGRPALRGDGGEPYRLAANEKLPRSVDHELEMFGCVACNFCITVCPNDAFFSIKSLEGMPDRQQYLVLAELCNECGNCMVFCPEDGDPALIKPRLYTDPEVFAGRDGTGLPARRERRRSGRRCPRRRRDGSLVRRLLASRAGTAPAGGHPVTGPDSELDGAAPGPLEETVGRDLRLAAAQMGPIGRHELASRGRRPPARAAAAGRRRPASSSSSSPSSPSPPSSPAGTSRTRSISTSTASTRPRCRDRRPSRLFDAAKHLGIGFSLGYAELTPDGHRYNTQILVERDGAIVGKYRKVHLPGHENTSPGASSSTSSAATSSRGDEFPTWEAFGGVVGMAICNDRRWPETYRCLGLGGAELILIGYNTPMHYAPDPSQDALQAFHNHLVMQAGRLPERQLRRRRRQGRHRGGCRVAGRQLHHRADAVA